jgi:hypothetical protein
MKYSIRHYLLCKRSAGEVCWEMFWDVCKYVRATVGRINGLVYVRGCGKDALYKVFKSKLLHQVLM